MCIVEVVKKLYKKNKAKRILKKVLETEYKGYNINQQSLESVLLLLAHSLEKGMSIPKTKKGYGIDKARNLLACQKKYLTDNGLKDSFALQESIAVLNAWITYSEASGVDVSKIKAEFGEIFNKYHNNAISAGYIEANDVGKLYDKIDKEVFSFYISTKRSVRSFKREPVSDKIMNEVVRLTLNAPSACNRQPCKIYWTSDMEKVSSINSLIPGNKGFEDQVSNWAIIVVDRSMFGANEGLQWYINGGIFLAYFTLSLHAYHLGSCIFQLPINHENIIKLKKLSGIDNNEAIIAAVGFGYPTEKLKYTVAQRKDVKETLFKLK